jgi:hypothetical protein
MAKQTFADRFHARFPGCDPHVAGYLICVAEFIVGDGAVPAAVAKPLLDTAGKHLESLQRNPLAGGYEQMLAIASDTPNKFVKRPASNPRKKSSRKTARRGKRRS